MPISSSLRHDLEFGLVRVGLSKLLERFRTKIVVAKLGKMSQSGLVCLFSLLGDFLPIIDAIRISLVFEMNEDGISTLVQGVVVHRKRPVLDLDQLSDTIKRIAGQEPDLSGDNSTRDG